MKTLKFMFMMMFLTLAIWSVSQASHRSDGFPIRISLAQALERSDLTAAIHRQVDVSLLNDEHPGLYVAHIRIGRLVVDVYGKYEEWRRFFYWKPVRNYSSPPIPD